MKDLQQGKPIFIRKILVLAGIAFSGCCWYLANELSGEFWYLLWVAPIPVLVISFNSSGKTAFIVSFIAYLIGRLSWFSYLERVATIVPAIIFTLALPLFFALIMSITRRSVINSGSWYGAFAFPVFFTAFEFLVIKFSQDGTAGSIAYSQSGFLPLIQIASVTGILGITFMVTLIPSAVAVGWYHRREKIKLRYITTTPFVIVAGVFLFGLMRMSDRIEKNTINVGLVILDEQAHHISDHPDFQKEAPLADSYAKEISQLAAQGAKLVLLPERAINMNKGNDSSIISMLSNTAKQDHVFVVTGYTNFRNEKERNSSLVINDAGAVIADYNKAHLVVGLERQFTPGTEIGLFTFNAAPVGTAICKDLDFSDYIKKYGKSNAACLFVPAWDFVRDDWLHSRMAILRGVENGFSEVRAARLGRLTISDYYGRVTDEANGSTGRRTVLLGKVSTKKIDTIYSRFGEWFGITNIIAAIFLVLSGVAKNNKKLI